MTRTLNKPIFAKQGLIVSCQALEHEPLHGGDAMAKMAKAAFQSGAIGIRTKRGGGSESHRIGGVTHEG